MRWRQHKIDVSIITILFGESWENRGEDHRIQTLNHWPYLLIIIHESTDTESLFDRSQDRGK